MGGRHQAPGKRRRSKPSGGPAAGGEGRAEPPVRPTPPPPGADVPRRSASWWVLVQVGVLALLVAAVGATLTVLHIVVDWREPLAGAALLLAPLLVRQVALRVRRRWLALVIGYGSFFLVGIGGHLAADPLLPHTATGFGSTVAGVVAAGLGFVLVSRLRTHGVDAGSAALAAGEPAGPPMSPPPGPGQPTGEPPAVPPGGFGPLGQPPVGAPPATSPPAGSSPDGPPPAAVPPGTPPPATHPTGPPPATPPADGAERADVPDDGDATGPTDESDTDLLPRVISAGQDDRDDDSLAG